MPAASILIKPASSNCNTDCQYCFYKCLSSNREKYSLGFMTEETLETLVREAVAYASGYLAFAFQGGEPALAGIEFYKRAVELQKRYNTKGLVIENTIQTNGLLLDEEWAEFLAREHFLVGLSLDGPRKLHDRYRQGPEGGGTFAEVMNTVKLLERFQVKYNIVSVITQDAAQQASYLYKFYKRNRFPFVQLIPCMDEQGRNNVQTDGTGKEDVTGQSPALQPDSYGRFLKEIFDLWYEDFMRGEDMEIRMFSNLAQMAAGFPAEQCGMNGRCSCYFVVEGNGDVYPCDFYCMDRWKLGTVADGFAELAMVQTARDFVASSERVEPECKECPHLVLCRGGCRRWREDGAGKIGLNALCHSYQIFFDYAGERLEGLGRMVSQRYGAVH